MCVLFIFNNSMNFVLVGPRIPWNQSTNPSSPVSTPATTSVLATQLNMPSGNLPIRHNNPNLQNMPPVSNIVSQAQNMNSIQGKIVCYMKLYFNVSFFLRICKFPVFLFLKKSICNVSGI